METSVHNFRFLPEDHVSIRGAIELPAAFLSQHIHLQASSRFTYLDNYFLFLIFHFLFCMCIFLASSFSFIAYLQSSSNYSELCCLLALPISSATFSILLLMHPYLHSTSLPFSVLSSSFFSYSLYFYECPCFLDCLRSISLLCILSAFEHY